MKPVIRLPCLAVALKIVALLAKSGDSTPLGQTPTRPGQRAARLSTVDHGEHRASLGASGGSLMVSRAGLAFHVTGQEG
jgi:hypothetical protein